MYRLLRKIMLGFRKTSTDAMEWVNKGNELFISGQLNEAIDCYSKAHEINPKFALAWSKKGDAFDRLGIIEDAVSCYERAIKIDPMDSRSRTIKNLLSERINKIKVEISECDRVLKLIPNDSAGFIREYFWKNLGNVLMLSLAMIMRLRLLKMKECG
jgi:tetratricopeptide (TPR) repeat protein